MKGVFSIVVTTTALLLLSLHPRCASATPLPDHWERGSCFFALSKGTMNATGTLDAVSQAKTSLGTLEVLPVAWMWFQDNASSNTVFQGPDCPSDDEISSFVRHAHSIGLKVLFKPVVVFHGGVMPDVNPSNLNLWFQSYSKLLLDTAVLAQKLKVAYLSVGLELQQISTNTAATKYWLRLIGQVRKVYTGRITYCSNPLTGETSHIPFHTHLDFIGADLYIPYVVSRAENASLILHRSEMIETFEYLLNLKLMNWYMNSSAKKAGIKLALTEIGYPSSNRGMQSPWMLPPDGTYCTGSYAGNFTAQAAAFDVAFEVLSSKHKDDLMMVAQFWFGMPGCKDYIGTKGQPGSLWECGWTPVEKNETMNTLREWYRRQ